QSISGWREVCTGLLDQAPETPIPEQTIYETSCRLSQRDCSREIPQWPANVWSEPSSYLGKFICPIRSWKRGLERRSSSLASTLRNKSHSACCWYEVSSH